jgi:hypothetical protein
MANLDQAVIDLHNIARLIEKTIGSGQLSADIRNCADRLHQIVKYNYIKTTEEK